MSFVLATLVSILFFLINRLENKMAREREVKKNARQRYRNIRGNHFDDFYQTSGQLYIAPNDNGHACMPDGNTSDV